MARTAAPGGHVGLLTEAQRQALAALGVERAEEPEPEPEPVQRPSRTDAWAVGLAAAQAFREHDRPSASTRGT
jgi:hypothetical protein